MNRRNEKGVALILALILLVIMSVMAVSLMFISQTETWASMNYKLMSQARDDAEAGINASANYLIHTYTPPAGSGSDLLSNYNNSVSPVQYPASNTTGHDVILATSSSSQSSNYPVASVVTNFGSSSQNSLTAGNTTVNYYSYATLLRQDVVTPWGTTTPVTVQTWQITSDGSINGVRAADEEVSAILEKQITPVFSYAAFATANGCGALNFGGGGTTASYDSSNLTMSGGLPVVSGSAGNVGTNGNLAENGNPTTINGNLSTPRTGVGTCTSGNVTAWTNTSGHVTGGLVELPQQVVYPTPDVPNPTPPTTSSTLHNNASDCSGITGCTFGTGPLPGGNGCPNGDFCLTPGTCAPPCPTCLPPLPGPAVYGNLTVRGTVHLYNVNVTLGTPPNQITVNEGCYNINSLTENGGGTITIEDTYPYTSPALSATNSPVKVNIAGSGQTTPLDLTGGGVINNLGWNPSLLQFLYGGTGTINVKGGANTVGLLYAPNATMSFNSAGGNWYGAVITGSMTDMGGASIKYDVNLQRSVATVSSWMLDSFTWKRN